MSLAPRLTKLETSHRRILWCLWCRYVLGPVSIQEQKRYDITEDSGLQTKCWYCGTRFLVPLRGMNEHQREAVGLFHNSDPTKQFTDEKVHAAQIWLSLYRSETKRYRESEQERIERERVTQGGRNSAHSSNRQFLTAKQEKDRRGREELERQAIGFLRAETERFKRLANGPDSFPLDETFERIQLEYPTSSYDAHIAEQVLSLGLEKYSKQGRQLQSALAGMRLRFVQRKVHRFMKPLTRVVTLISALVLSANAADTATGFHARLFNTTDNDNTAIRVEEPDRANFSGEWKLNEAKSDLGQQASYATRVLKVEQTDDSISFARTAPTFTGEEFTAMETLSFDGKESESNLAGTSKKKASAKWSEDGQTLTITYKLLIDFNGQVTEVTGTEALTLSDDGKTLVSQSSSSSSFGDLTSKAVYDKQ